MFGKQYLNFLLGIKPPPPQPAPVAYRPAPPPTPVLPKPTRSGWGNG